MHKKITVQQFLANHNITPPTNSGERTRQNVPEDLQQRLEGVMFDLFLNGNKYDSIRVMVTRALQKAKKKSDEM